VSEQIPTRDDLVYMIQIGCIDNAFDGKLPGEPIELSFYGFIADTLGNFCRNDCFDGAARLMVFEFPVAQQFLAFNRLGIMRPALLRSRPAKTHQTEPLCLSLPCGKARRYVRHEGHHTMFVLARVLASTC
jgi:hypothetical protein